jgi:chromosome segregation ATPase
MVLDMVNQNIQETLEKFQDNKNREFEKAQKQLKEAIEALYKHQSETKNRKNKEINELRTKIDNTKEEETQDMENQNKPEMQNKMEVQSSRLEQAEDKISELEDEMVIKGKTKELLVKKLKTYEKKMKELSDSIKRPNLRIMGIEEGEEVQAKGMHNIFNKIIAENFSNLKKTMPIQVQDLMGSLLNSIRPLKRTNTNPS